MTPNIYYRRIYAYNSHQAAKQLLENKACVSSVGDLFVLPFAEDLGLKV
jgi:hypothetical protein